MSWLIVGAASVAVFEGISSSSAISNNANVQEQVAQQNAKYAELDAYNAEQEGNGKASRYASTADQQEGNTKVAEAAGGVDVNFGTGAEIGAQSKLAAFTNTLNIKAQAQQKALGYDVQANNIQLQGNVGLSSAAMESETSVIKGVGSAAAIGASGYSKNTGVQPDDFMDDD